MVGILIKISNLIQAEIFRPQAKAPTFSAFQLEILDFE